MARTSSDDDNKPVKVTRPIEDIGVVVIDSPMVTITSGLMEALLYVTPIICRCPTFQIVGITAFYRT